MKTDIVVHFRVNRFTGELEKGNSQSAAKGGCTVAGRLSEDRKSIFWAVSRCYEGDAFNYKRGHAAALGKTRSPKYAVETPNVEYNVALKLARVIAKHARFFNPPKRKNENTARLNLNTYIAKIEAGDSDEVIEGSLYLQD